MIHVILVLIPAKNLRVQQMDVKGAYLNGLLQEWVCMQQSNGFSSEMNHVCCLIKTIYDLKQAGWEWNKVLDTRLKRQRFWPLKSDSCVYVWHKETDLEIITVWINDLLLFTTSDKIMTHFKAELKLVFDLTNIGELNKIVSIEITHWGDSIMICQKNYIESILKQEGMSDAHPVKNPLDLKNHFETTSRRQKWWLQQYIHVPNWIPSISFHCHMPRYHIHSRLIECVYGESEFGHSFLFSYHHMHSHLVPAHCLQWHLALWTFIQSPQIFNRHVLLYRRTCPQGH